MSPTTHSSHGQDPHADLVESPASATPSPTGPASPPTSLWRRGLAIPRRLYDWVLGWAETRYGVPALALISFAESSFFPIPPDPLLMALALGRRTRALFYSSICTVASVLGGLFGYWIGVVAFDMVGQPIIDFYGYQQLFDQKSALFQENGFTAVLIAATTPIPYKLVTITAGACSVPIVPFIIASVVGRGFRFYLLGALIQFFGDPIRRFIDRYFGWLCTAFGVLVAAGFIVIKYVL